MKFLFRLIIIVIIFISGCCAIPLKSNTKSDVSILGSWKAPAESPFIKPESGAEYPAPYPAIAIVTQSQLQKEKSFFHDNATLFIMSERKLDENRLVEQIPSMTLLAQPVLLPVRGAWIKFENVGYFFVVMHPTSGNSREQHIEVFRHDIFWSGDNFENQNHRFYSVFQTYSLWPYIADSNGNGKMELIVTAEDYGSESSGKTAYDIFEWDSHSHEFMKKGHISEQQIQSLKRISILTDGK